MHEDAFNLHYCIGIEEIDRDHWFLLECISGINHLIEKGEKQKAYEKILTLRDGLCKHFKFEEKLMDLAAFPYVEAHKADHLRGIASLDRIYNNLTLLGHGRKNYLADFEVEMMNHLDHMDMQYVSYIKVWLNTNKEVNVDVI